MNNKNNDMKFSVPRLPADSFDWSRWRLGIMVWREIGVQCRTQEIIRLGHILRSYAVGYIPADKIFCRPKNDEIAVLFLINDEFCWTHLLKKEFENVFSE